MKSLGRLCPQFNAFTSSSGIEEGSFSTTESTPNKRVESAPHDVPERKRHPDLQNWTLRLYPVEQKRKDSASADDRPTDKDLARFGIIDTANLLGAPNYRRRVEIGRYQAKRRSIFLVNDRQFTLAQIQSASRKYIDKLIVAQQYHNVVCEARQRACNKYQANTTADRKEAMQDAWQAWDRSREALKALENQARQWREMQETEVPANAGEAATLIYRPQLRNLFPLPVFAGTILLRSVMPKPQCQPSSAFEDDLFDDLS